MTNLKQTAIFRRILIGLGIFCIVSFVTMINASVILAQITPHLDSNLDQAFPSSPNDIIYTGATPALEFTSVATIYLPTIRRANNNSTPANCNPTGGSGGFGPGIYDTTIAGLKAIVVVGKGYDPQKPTYLGFNIHGDGGNYDRIKKTDDGLTKLANKRGWILVSPLAPDGHSWWQDWSQSVNDAFARLLDDMFRKYNVCRDIVYGTTGSGGSDFWTSYFFPDQGGQYPAHTVIACGGSSGHDLNAVKQIAALGKNATVVARSTFYYLYGSDDYLYDNIQRSINRYRNAGFNVQVQEIAGAGHCNDWKDQGFPDWHQQAGAIWDRWAQ